MKPVLLIAVIIGCLTGTTVATAQSVLKEKQIPSIMKHLVESAPEYATMVKLLNTADLAETLEGPGPMTLFTPDNKAFETLPAGTVRNWEKPEMKDSLQKILTYHVVAGNWPLADIIKNIKQAGGEFVLPTIGEPGKLSFVLEDGRVMVKDSRGFKSALGVPVTEQNGMAYHIDKVLFR